MKKKKPVYASQDPGLIIVLANAVVAAGERRDCHPTCVFFRVEVGPDRRKRRTCVLSAGQPTELKPPRKKVVHFGDCRDDQAARRSDVCIASSEKAASWMRKDMWNRRLSGMGIF